MPNMPFCGLDGTCAGASMSAPTGSALTGTPPGGSMLTSHPPAGAGAGSSSSRSAARPPGPHRRPRRAAGQVDVDRDDVIHALHDRVVVEHPAGRRADTHGNDRARFGHLV